MMAGSRLTVEAFYQRRDEWPEGGRWCELVDGEVIELSPPDVMHSGVVLNLASKLGVYAQETQNGYACFDIGFVVARCPDTVRKHTHSTCRQYMYLFCFGRRTLNQRVLQ